MKILGPVKTIGIILAAILALIQIGAWVSKALEKDLTATVTYGVFVLPNALNAEFKKYHELTDRPALDSAVAELLKSIHNQDEQHLASRILDQVSWFTRSNTPNEIPLDYSLLNGYWSVDVVNEGPKALSSVTLYLPYAARVAIRRTGENTVESKCEEVIRLGTLQPQEEVFLFAWTKSAPSAYNIGQIKLTHDAGVGEVITLVPTGQLGQWFENNSWFLLWILVIVVLVVILYYIQTKSVDKGAGEPPASEDARIGSGDVTSTKHSDQPKSSSGSKTTNA